MSYLHFLVYVSASQTPPSDNLSSHRHQNKEALLELSQMSPELSALLKKKLDVIENVAKKGIGTVYIFASSANMDTIHGITIYVF